MQTSEVHTGVEATVSWEVLIFFELRGEIPRSAGQFDGGISPAKLSQKDRDARWTVKWSKARPADDGSPRVDLAIPAFGYKNHIGIDRRHGLIRTWVASDAAHPQWGATAEPGHLQ
jgi:hypothetical protein